MLYFSLNVLSIGSNFQGFHVPLPFFFFFFNLFGELRMLNFMPIFSQNFYVYEFWSLHASLRKEILYIFGELQNAY